MARPREHSDDDLLDHVGASLADASGARTMAEAARAAGVHPATLVKRFGSWHGVLVALSRRWIAGIPETPRTRDCTGELRSWVAEVARPPLDRSHRVAGIAMLLEDLKDDELSRLLHQGWELQIAYLAALVSGAHREGHLTRSPGPRTAATLLLDLVNGFHLRAAASARSSATADGAQQPEGTQRPEGTPQTLLNSLLESWT